MNTIPSTPADLAGLLAGLEQAWQPSDPNPLSQALLQQGQAQGLALTEREAQLAAQVILLQRGQAGSAALDAPLSSSQLRTFFRLPKLTPTDQQRARRWAAWRDPKRWGPELGCAVLGAGVTGVLVWLVKTIGDWNGHSHFFQQSGWWHGALGWVFAVVFTSGVLLGATLALMGLWKALTGGDAELKAARRAAYQERLATLSNTQLVQLFATLQSEHRNTRSGLLAQGELLLELTHGALAERGLAE